MWASRDPGREPDLVIYDVHGGGFAMGSSYFYLEFLLTWLSLLERTGYKTHPYFRSSIHSFLTPHTQRRNKRPQRRLNMSSAWLLIHRGFALVEIPQEGCSS